MIQWLAAGGPVMVPIGLASVVALAVFLERLWSLRRERIVPRGFCVELVELVRQQRYSDAHTLCKKHDVPMARIIDVAIESREEPRALVKERAEEIGKREVAELERYLPVLGLIGSIGPLLGLLGTVSGMIRTFAAVEAGGIGNMEFVAGGISEALICTLFGLLVAIPSVTAHRYLSSKVDGLVIDMEEVSIGVIDLLTGERQQKAAK